MYTPPHNEVKDLPAIHALMRAARLAQLITTGPAGILATPVPMILHAEEGPCGTLYGHIAKANPQWKQAVPAVEALVLFNGPDAYITPAWYAGKATHGKEVPTWNYVAAHAYGPVEFFHEPERLLDVVTRLTDLHEATRPAPWSVADAPADFIQSQLRGIVGLRIPITRLQGKRKTSQNRTLQDRTTVAQGLAQSEREADRQIASQIPIE